ncbi:AMP-binding protein [Halioxenophilus sp. WMMB6]|uniref:AMP-binding protein n=1 Tax=Halioxenophilus sp. WMMB6 TaxID=3073815 RepID=UPI00295F3EF8|nr:AMP-binding protein [Halioxenophilus sp. WMMB6]
MELRYAKEQGTSLPQFDNTLLNRKLIQACELTINEPTKSFVRVRFVVARQTLFEEELNQLAEDVDHVCQVTALPLTAGGQVDEDKLRALYTSNTLCSHNIAQSAMRALAPENHNREDYYFFLGKADNHPGYLHKHSLLPLRVQPNEPEASAESTPNSPSYLYQQRSPLTAVSSEHSNPLCESQTQAPQTLAELLTIRGEQETPPELVFLAADGVSRDSLDCQELLQLAKATAAGLLAQGVKAHDNVIIHTQSLKNTIVAFWGSILADAVPVITSTWTSAQASDKDLQKFDYVCSSLAGARIIADAPAAEFLRGQTDYAFAQLSPLLVEQLLTTDTQSLALSPATNPDEIAFLCMTSGSTGMPKFVQLTHANLLSRSKGAIDIWQNSSADVTLNWLPFDHIGSISDWHIRCIVAGCKSIYTPTNVILSNPVNLLNLIDEFRVSHTWATDSAYRTIINTLKSSKDTFTWDLSCVDTFLNAAEPISESTARELISHLQKFHLRTNCIVPAFGMAEMCSGVTYSRPPTDEINKQIYIDRDSFNESQLRLVKKGTPNCVASTCLGPIIPGMSMRIVDEKNHVLPELCNGQLQIRGLGVTQGYLNNPEANAELFSEDGWLNTGDKGFIFEGELYLSGRSKDTLIINGANFSPIDFESIVDKIPGIVNTYSAAIQARAPGDNKESLVLFFCPEPHINADQELQALAAEISDKIAETHKLKPDYIIPEATVNIPKTSIQKIQRSALVKKFESGHYTATAEKMDLLLGTERTIENSLLTCHWHNDSHQANIAIATKGLVVLTNSFNPTVVEYLKNSATTQHSVVVLTTNEPPESLALRANSNIQIVQVDYDQLNEALDGLWIEQDYKILDLRLADHFAIDHLPAPGDFADQVISLNRAFTLLAKTSLFEKTLHYCLVGLAPSISEDIFVSLASYYRAVAGTLGFGAKSVYFDKDISHKNPLCAALIHEELQTVAGAPDVRYVTQHQNGKQQRQTRQYKGWAANDTHNLPELSKDQWVLVTGGLGGVGVNICRWLASKQVKLLVVGSTAESDLQQVRPAQFEQLQLLRKECTVEYRRHKILNSGEFLSAIQTWQQELGEYFSAVFHLAGSVAERDNNEISKSDLQKVWLPKIEGALAIGQLAKQQTDLLAVYFSSITAEMAEAQSSGLPAYAATNQQLSQLATSQRAQGIKAYAIAWSSWKGLGMSASLPGEVIQSQGLVVLNNRAAITALEAILRRQPQNVMVGVNRFADGFRSYNSGEARSPHQLLCAKLDENLVDTKNSALPERITIGQHPALMLKFSELPSNDHGVDHAALRPKFSLHKNVRIDPKTETQKNLFEIWTTLLGHEEFGITDNFYNVGGSSLLTANLLDKITTTWPVEFSLGDFFTIATIEAQAKAIEQLLAGGSDDTPAPRKRLNKDRVICLQNESDNRPIFCLCGIEIYSELANALKEVAPVYAIYLFMEEQALNQDRILNVDGMAKAYARVIKEIQPEGPYRLMGVSFGSVIGYELAKLLTQEGNEVELLGVLDFNLPENAHKRLSLTNLKSSLTLTKLFGLRKLKRLIQRLYPNYKLNALPVAVHYKRAFFNNYRRRITRWNHPEKVVIFRAENEPSFPGYSAEAHGGWDQMLTDTPDAYWIEGDHLGILKANGAHQIAAQLKDILAIS